MPDVGEAELRAMAQDEAHLELIRDERIRSRMLVPLSSRDRIFGAISLATSGSGRVFDADDLRLAEEIGRRTGAGLENARLYVERSQIATTLQESLLPPELPAIPGLRDRRPLPAHAERWAWSAETSTTSSRRGGSAGRWPSATSAARGPTPPP